jgi:adenosylhomocysteinase
VTTALPGHEIRDPALAAEGRRRADWARRQMPVLAQLAERVARDGALRGARLAVCAHVTSETAVLVEGLLAAGAGVALCASNPLSTQDDVAAYLAVDLGVPTFAVRGESAADCARHLGLCLDTFAAGAPDAPRLVVDDGADLAAALHDRRRDLLARVVGATEETTTGIIRLRALAAEGILGFPVVAVNDAQTKHHFDNRYGTGQNTVDGILRATNVLLAGLRVVVVGFGWCGRGIAARARGMGAHVTVCEVEPVRALEAVMEGYDVLPFAEAAAQGDLIVTATGNRGVVRPEHVERMKDGALLANSGHFDVEIDVAGLRALARARRAVRDHVEEYELPSGRRVYLLAQGRLVGQAAAEASPAAVMDLSFSNQLLAVEYLARRAAGAPLAPAVYPVPPEVDAEIARLKLAALGLRIDRLSDEQRTYLASWRAAAWPHAAVV